MAYWGYKTRANFAVWLIVVALIVTGISWLIFGAIGLAKCGSCYNDVKDLEDIANLLDMASSTSSAASASLIASGRRRLSQDVTDGAGSTNGVDDAGSSETSSDSADDTADDTTTSDSADDTAVDTTTSDSADDTADDATSSGSVDDTADDTANDDTDTIDTDIAFDMGDRDCSATIAAFGVHEPKKVMSGKYSKDLFKWCVMYYGGLPGIVAGGAAFFIGLLLLPYFAFAKLPHGEVSGSMTKVRPAAIP